MYSMMIRVNNTLLNTRNLLREKISGFRIPYTHTQKVIIWENGSDYGNHYTVYMYIETSWYTP